MGVGARALLLAAVLASHGPEAVSQSVSEDIVEVLREEFQDGEIAELFQSFSILGVTPGLSGASYKIDDDDPETSALEIKSFKFPIRREVKSGEFCVVESDGRDNSDYSFVLPKQSPSAGALCVKPYTELTFSHLRAEESIDLSDFETEFGYEITTISALAGLGLSIPLSPNTTFRPIFLAGYTHIDSDAEFDGVLAAEFGEGLDGLLDNADLNAVLVGGAAELQHQRLLNNKVELEGRLRYNYLVSDVFDASDNSLEQTNDFVVVTSHLEASIPTDLRFFSRDLRVLGFGGSNLIFTKLGEEIDAEDFVHEIGGGLELRPLPFAKAVRLRASVLFGDDVTGVRAGLAIKF